MDKVEKIIDRIKKAGDLEAEQIVKNATQDAEGVVSLAKIQTSDYIKKQSEEKISLCEAELQNAKNSAMQYTSREILRVKNEAINNVFELALNELKEMKSAEYKKFLTALLTKYAKSGDEVIYSSNHKGEKSIISGLAVFKTKKLKLGEVTETISGGVIISNSKYNIDLSFEGLIKDKKERDFVSIAKQIF